VQDAIATKLAQRSAALREESFVAPVEIQMPDKPFGTHAFTLTGPDPDPRHLKWLAVGLPARTNEFRRALGNSAPPESHLSLEVTGDA
jgi:hypothetical protein